MKDQRTLGHNLANQVGQGFTPILGQFWMQLHSSHLFGLQMAAPKMAITRVTMWHTFQLLECRAQMGNIGSGDCF